MATCPAAGCENPDGFVCIRHDCVSLPPSEVDHLKAQVATLEARLEATETKSDDLDRRVGATEALTAAMDVRLDVVSEAVSLPVATSELVG